MGAMTSRSDTVLPGYLALTFQSPDKIVIIDPGAQCLVLIQEIVAAKWARGVQMQQYNNGSFEIKLRGRPFLTPLLTMSNSASNQVAEGRVLFCELLTELRRAKWTIALCSHNGKSANCMTWFLKNSEFEVSKDEDALSEHTICLGIRSRDRLQLLRAFPVIELIVTDTIASILQDTLTLENGLEAKLQGTPWTAENFEAEAEARRILLSILRKFSGAGYELHCTAAIKGFARIDSFLFLKTNRKVKEPLQKYCLLSLDMKDRIRMLEFTPALIETVEAAVRNHWSKGIQQKRPHYLGLAELKLSGNPWFSDGEDGIAGRRLFVAILHSLLAVGWRVAAVISVSEKRNDKSAFLLQQCEKLKTPFFCLYPCKYDLIRVIDGPPELLKLVHNVISTHWTKGIQAEAERPVGVKEWKLVGNPWTMYDSNSQDVIAGRLLLLQLLCELDRFGWKVVCSADTSSRTVQDDGGYNISEDGDSWFIAQISNMS